MKGKFVHVLAMKTFRGNGGIVPLIFNLRNRWECWYPLTRRMGGLWRPSEFFLQKSRISTLFEILTWDPPTRDLVTIPSMLF